MTQKLQLSDIPDMTLLQVMTIPDAELKRLMREAVEVVNQSSRSLNRLRNARYLQRLARAREIVGGMEGEDE